MNQTTLAILSVTLGFLLFSVWDLLVKTLGTDYSIIQLLFFTGLSGLIILGTIGFAHKGRAAFHTQNLKIQILRGCCIVGINVLNIFALKYIQLAELYAVMFLSPILIPTLCAVFLKDHPGWKRWIAIFIGFTTAIYMLRPSGELFNIGGFAALGGATCFSLAFFFVRFLGPEESPYTNAITGNIAALVFAAPLLAGNFIWPHGIDMLWMILLGFVNAIGSVFLIIGFQRAPAVATVAPFQYSQMIWGLLFGYLFFADMPSVSVLIGAFVLTLMGIYIIRSERNSGHQAPGSP